MTAKNLTTAGAGFAQNYAELEKIVEWFEHEEVDVEEGLKKFERGLVLASVCKERLSAVENRVREIKDKFTGSEAEKET